MSSEIASSDHESPEGRQASNASSDVANAHNWLVDHADYLFRYALIRVRDVSSAEDLVQETLLAAMRSERRTDSESSERAWLTGILRHKVADHFRRLNRERPVIEDATLPNELESRFDDVGVWMREPDLGPAEWSADAASLMQRKEFMSALKECLAKLPKRCADAFVLREMEDVESSAVQEILGVSANNFWVLLHRARIQLRLCLERNWMRIGTQLED